jgi:hypothetical protein
LERENVFAGNEPPKQLGGTPAAQKAEKGGETHPAPK